MSAREKGRKSAREEGRGRKRRRSTKREQEQEKSAFKSGMMKNKAGVCGGSYGSIQRDYAFVGVCDSLRSLWGFVWEHTTGLCVCGSL